MFHTPGRQRKSFQTGPIPTKWNIGKHNSIDIYQFKSILGKLRTKTPKLGSNSSTSRLNVVLFFAGRMLNGEGGVFGTLWWWSSARCEWRLKRCGDNVSFNSLIITYMMLSSKLYIRELWSVFWSVCAVYERKGHTFTPIWFVAFFWPVQLLFAAHGGSTRFFQSTGTPNFWFMLYLDISCNCSKLHLLEVITKMFLLNKFCYFAPGLQISLLNSASKADFWESWIWTVERLQFKKVKRNINWNINMNIMKNSNDVVIFKSLWFFLRYGRFWIGSFMTIPSGRWESGTWSSFVFDPSTGGVTRGSVRRWVQIFWGLFSGVSKESQFHKPSWDVAFGLGLFVLYPFFSDPQNLTR